MNRILQSLPVFLAAVCCIAADDPTSSDLPNDPSPKTYNLDDCIKVALERNEGVKAAQAELEYYRGKYKEAFSYFWLPHISGNALIGGPVASEMKNITRVTYVSNLAAMGVSDAGFVLQGSLEFLWPVYTFGKLGALLDAAESGVNAANFGVKSAKNIVISNTRKSYFGMMLAQEISGILDDGKGQLDDARKRIVDLLESEDPQATEKDLFKIDYYAAEINARLDDARKGRVLAEDTLRTVVGFKPDEKAAFATAKLDEGLGTLEPANTWVERAISDSPELKALGAAVQARAGIMKAASRAYYPDIFLGGGLRFSWTNISYKQLSYLLLDDVNYFGAGFGLGLRFDLDIGPKIGQSDQARAEFSKLSAQARLA
jgi:outer membrane protein TolC